MLVDGNETGEPVRDHKVKEFAVTCSTSCPGSSRLSGRGTHSSSSSRMRLDHLSAKLERRDCLLACHAREVVKELVQGVARFEVVK